MSRKRRREKPMDFGWMDFDAPDERIIRAERDKARALRKTRWWQQKTADGRCSYCHREVGFDNLTMDHVLPLSRGGRSTKENIVACCAECNKLKRSMMPIAWDEYCEQFQEK
ncbi:HNH endonuclease [Desulforhopalus vacuolatus]|uniref:HNH endonuclease n=1 Tax=Desulforhopalus vacuolatus TaxID=40414 RepID=UPI003084452A